MKPSSFRQIRAIRLSRVPSQKWFRAAALLCLLGWALPSPAEAQEVSQKEEIEKPGDRQEVDDRSLYLDAVFAETFEKNAKKAERLFEGLLERRISDNNLHWEAEYHYSRLLLSTGQIDRYIAHLRRVLKLKGLSRNMRKRLQSVLQTLKSRSPAIHKTIADYKKRILKTKDPKVREAISQSFLHELKQLTGLGRPSFSRQILRPPGKDEHLIQRLQRIKDLRQKIEDLQKAGKGNSAEAQKVHQELTRIINQRDLRGGHDRRGSRRFRGMMRGFYKARQKIEKSRDQSRLKDFEKLSRELRSLLISGQARKAQELLKEAYKRFPELLQSQRR